MTVLFIAHYGAGKPASNPQKVHFDIEVRGNLACAFIQMVCRS